MNGLRKTQFALLCEFNKICRENNISYILTGLTAYAAFTKHEMPETVVVPTVAMRYCDALKAAKKLVSPKREVESAFSNRHIDRMVIRYSDSDTFFFMADESGSFKKSGIGIDIEIIRQVQPIINKMLIIAEALCSVFARLRNTARLSRPLLYALGLIERFFLRGIYSLSFGKKNRQLRISRFPRKSVTFPEILIEKKEEISVNGESFYVSADIQAYFRAEFGVDWQTNAKKTSESSTAIAIWDETTAYRAVDFKYYPRGEIRWFRWFFLRAEMRYLRKKIDGMWNILLYTRDYFKLSRIYLPQKEHIVSLYNNGKNDELEKIMECYIEAIDRHAANKLGLNIDTELFDIALKIHQKGNDKGYAGKVRRLVPKKFIVNKGGIK